MMSIGRTRLTYFTYSVQPVKKFENLIQFRKVRRFFFFIFFCLTIIPKAITSRHTAFEIICVRELSGERRSRRYGA